MTAENIPHRNAEFAQQLVQRLCEAGCAGFVVSPGSRHTPIVMAAANTATPVEVILDERSAGFFALGWAKAAREPIALVCTSGSAGAHYLPAIIEARETGVPLIVVTADRPPEHQDIGAPQTTFQDGFYQRHIKGYLGIGAADDEQAFEKLPELASLVATVSQGKPGPVHLNIGFREPLWEAAPRALPRNRAIETPEPTPSLDELPKLPSTQRGLVVAGPIQEAHPEAQAAARAVIQMARRLGWPVLADIASGLRQGPENSASLVSGYDLFLRSETVRSALEPDFVLHIGRMPTSKIVFTWLQALEDKGTQVWNITTDGQAHTLASKPRLVRTTWRKLGNYCQATSTETSPDPDWMQGWRRAETITQEVVSKQTAEVAIWEGEISAIATRIPRKGRLILASGMAIRDADSYASKLPPDSECLVNRGVNGIDGLIATAAGVAAQDSTRQVRLLIGDLAFQHDIGSLAAAATRPNLDIVVISNGGGGIFEFLPIRQATDKFDRFFLTPQNLNIPAVTAGFGIASYRCESASELELVLAAAKSGCRVTEVVVDRQHNVNIHKTIGSAVRARLNKEFLLEQVDGEGNTTPGGGLEPGKRFSGH